MPFIIQGKTNWKFILIVIIISIIVGGWILFVLTLPIPPSWQSPPKIDEKYCKKDSDCVLNYTGSETCPSCVSDDYQCVSLEYYNKVLWPEWEKNHKGILCEGCPMVTEKIQCVCEKNLCKKIIKDETADWKTYRNEEYGFEVKYPLEWSYKVISEKQVEFREKGKTYSVEESDIYAIGIFIYENPGNLTTEQIVEERKSEAGWPVEIKTLTVDNTDAAQTIDYLQQNTIIVKNKKIYHIVIPSNMNKSVHEVYDKMLSAFKFLEAPISETKALVVYLTDNKYDGNLGGRQGADAKCNSPSGLNCKSGTIHALLTVDKNDSIINMADNYGFDKELPIYWFNKESKKITILASNWYQMLNENIINGQGDGTGKYSFSWTGGRGDIETSTCSGWTKNENDPRVQYGSLGIFGGWIDKEDFLSASGWAGITNSRTCNNKWYLRCICEGTVTD